MLSLYILRKTKNCYKSTNIIRLNKKNKCVLGNGSENFREGRHIFLFFNYFFFGKNIILCILKGKIAFQNA